MKNATLIAGIVLSLSGLVQGGRYVFDYEKLAPYGKGFVWGSVFLFLAGVGLVYLALRKRRASGAQRRMP
jgi:hypothetical protein